MNAYEVISLAHHPYVLGIIPEQVLFAVILCARYNTKNNFQHTSIFCIHHHTQHEVQVLSKKADLFRISSVFFYSSNALGLINRVNPFVTNRNCTYEEIRQQSKRTSPVVVIKYYDSLVATAKLLFYIWVVIMTRHHPLVTSALIQKNRYLHLQVPVNICNSCQISWDRLIKPAYAQAQALWEPVMPPADGRPPIGCNGRYWRPRPPSSASVIGGGDLDRPTCRTDCRGSVRSITSHPGGRGAALFRTARRVRHPCLTREPRLRGIPGHGDGVPHPARVRPGRNGAPSALVLLRTSRSIFHGPAAIRILWGSPFRAPPPPVVEIPGEAFMVQRAVSAILRADRQFHVEVAPPPHWQLMSCETAGKLQENSRDLDCWGLIFVTPDGASLLLGRGANIAEVSWLLISLLASRAPPYYGALDWLLPTWGDWTGSYVDPASTDLVLPPSRRESRSLLCRSGAFRLYNLGLKPVGLLLDL